MSKMLLYTHCNKVKEVCHWLPVKLRIDFKIISLTYCICLNSSRSTPLLALSGHHRSHASRVQTLPITRARNALVPAPSDLQLLPSGIAFSSPSKLILQASVEDTFSQSSRLIPAPTPSPASRSWPSIRFLFLPSFLVIDLFIYLFYIPHTLRH